MFKRLASRSHLGPLFNVVLVLLSCFVQFGQSADTSCLELGFTPSLMCSSCEKLYTYVNDEELQAECLKCCASDKVESNTQYPFATLKVDSSRYFFFPRVETFVFEKAKDFPGLRVKHRSGIYPTITLEDASGQTMETITGIENWELHTIVDFLKEKLVDGKGGLGL